MAPGAGAGHRRTGSVLGTQSVRFSPMYAETEASEAPVAPRERVLLRLLSEQGAVPLDQLARFLAVDLAEAVAVVQAFEDRGWSESRRFLVRTIPGAG